MLCPLCHHHRSFRGPLPLTFPLPLNPFPSTQVLAPRAPQQRNRASSTQTANALPFAVEMTPPLGNNHHAQPMMVLAQEMEEVSMHIPAWQLMNCEAALATPSGGFGFPKLTAAPSVKIPASFTMEEPASKQQQHLQQVVEEQRIGELPTLTSPLEASPLLLKYTKAMAACLATPIEPPPNPHAATRTVLRLVSGQGGATGCTLLSPR
jgi:hypothetical protein